MHDVRYVGAVALVLLSQSRFLRSAEVEHAVELEEVVVSASPIGDADRLATIAGSVGRDQLLRSGGNTVADALAQVPGVHSSGFAAGAGRPVIRGMDANRVRTLEDGIGSFDASDVGPDHGVPIEPFAAERVEIVRGAATLRYGSQAIGGVVNAITSRVPLRLADGAREGEMVGAFGSGADSRDVAGQFNARRGAFAVHGDGFSRRSGNYATPDGPMANSWLRGEGGALGGAWIGDAHRAGVSATRTESRYGIPGEEAWIDMEQTRLLMRSAWSVSAGPFSRLAVDAGWADYTHSERDDAGSALSTFNDDEWDARAEAVGGAWGPFRESALGVQLQQRDFEALGEGEEYLAPTRTRSRALFGFAESALSARTRLQFGARIEDVQVRGTPASDVPLARGFKPISASVGLLFEPAPHWRMGLSLSSAARAPAQTELFARGVHEATGTWEIGLPTLRQERANSAELSLRWRGTRVHADGSVWVTGFRNYIHGALTGRSCSEEGDCADGDGEELTELLYTQRGALFRGAEAHAEIELRQGAGGDLHLNLLADTVRARLDDGGGNVPRIPAWRVGAGLSWQGRRVDASVALRYTGRQSRVAAAETPTAGFTHLDADFAWRPWNQHPGVSIALGARNLTDSRQRNALALNKDEVLLPRRDIRLVFRARFD